MLGPEEEQSAERAAGGVAEEAVPGVAEDQREEAAEQALERAFEQEGAADEPVGGPHQAHDGDLPRPLEDGEPDGDADDHDGDGGEGQADHQADQAGHVAELVEPLDPVSPVAHVVDEAEAPDPLRDPADDSRLAEPLLEPHLDRGGEGIGLEVAVGVAKLDQLGARAVQGLRLRHEAHVLHFGEGRDVLGGERDRLGGRPPQHEGDDLHPLLDAPERLAQVDRDQPEEPKGEERKGDGGDGERGQERRPAEGEQRLAGEEPHEASVSSVSSTAVS